MALQVTATKSTFVLMGAYLMIAECLIQKSVNREPAPPPAEEDESWEPHTVYTPETSYRAVVHVYPEYQERIEQYGTPLISFNIQFDSAGGNLTAEAYAHIKATGIPGWIVNEMVDA